MTENSVRFTDLREGLPFGSKISGLTRKSLKDEGIREGIRRAFEDRGLLVFEDVEESPEMQLAISDVLGPLKDHPVANVARTNEALAPGIIDLRNGPDDDTTIVEIDGQLLTNWLPWHFDHSYNNELNRAGVLRPIDIAPDGGLTGFADGIELYKTLSPELRGKIEGINVIYTLDLLLENQKFGKPDSLRAVREAKAAIEVSALAKTMPRAIHPAVWTRKTGEKVLHVGALHAVGLKGHENPEGDALLKRVCREIAESPGVYYHQWMTGQMLTWDNWRMLHSVTGTHPRNARRMHRTTIKGDYGLGYFEGGGKGGAVLERTY